MQHGSQKIKQIEHERTSSFIKDAIRDQLDGTVPGSETLVKIAESLNLRSNQEILIEAVALEKLKENAEQAEKAGEVEFLDQMISLITRMHERLVTIKQSQICSPVPIPPDFCCPLSLELMTDPVIVASGQTYERAFIKNWIDLGLTVCPKTRQTLAHTTLIPNYTVKALIANWCELNNVRLPDPVKIMSLNQPSPLFRGDSTPPRDSHGFTPSRTPVESIRSAGSPGNNLNSSTGHHRDPLHLRSGSDGSTGGQGLDIARMTLASSDEGCINSEARSTELDRQHSVSPSRRTSSTAADTVEESSHTHNRNASASSELSNSNFSQGVGGDANGTSEVPHHSNEASGEVNSESQTSSTMTTPREPEFPSRLLSRNHMIWRRPSERYVPRIVSNSNETRPDLSGIEAQVRKLIEDLNNSSIDTQRDAVYELRLLAKHNMDNRMVIANCGAISLLVNLLYSEDAKIQEHAVTALLNLSINDNNKTAIANAEAIGPLIHVLETGSPEAKENSAATLFSLSVIEDNKIRIGRSGAIGPLVDLLGNGTPRGKKDAATALFNLSIYHENKARIVQAGAVRHLVELMDPAAGMVDKAVAVLANLATIPEGRAAIGQENGIPVLVEVVELGSARGKENAAAALLQLCTNSNRFCNMVLQEGAVPPLVALSQSGTPRAKEKVLLVTILMCMYVHICACIAIY